MYRLKYKIWLDKGGGKAFGDGPYQLLRGIRETGSLNQAAKSMNMSYSLAYNLLKQMEERLGFSLIISKTGGTGGGGSSLTQEAESLMRQYQEFKEECDALIRNCFEKHFCIKVLEKNR